VASSAASRIVALIGRNDGARDQLRKALLELGATVAVEAEPAEVQPQQVVGTGINAVIVNLAAGVDDEIEHLQALFDDPQVNVIFNEAEVSSSLEGWDLARWARHLAAKLLGHGDTLPPPPPGAAALVGDASAELRPGAPPTPAQQTVQRPIEEFVMEAEVHVDDVPENHLPLSSESAAAPAAEAEEFSFDFDLSALESALVEGQVPEQPVQAPVVETPTSAPKQEETIDLPEIEFDLDSLVASGNHVPESAPAEPAQPAAQDEEVIDFSGMDFDLDGLEEAAAEESVSFETTPSKPDEEEIAIDVGDFSLDSLNFEEDATRVARPSSAPEPSIQFTNDNIELDESNLLDDDVAALAASLDELERSLPETPMVDDFSSLPSLDDLPDDRPAKPSPSSPAKPDFGSLSLSDPDAPFEASAPAAKPSGNAFGGGFGSLSLVGMDEEHAPAAPAPKKAEFEATFSSSLSLAPLDDEEGGVDPLMVAMGLVDAPAQPGSEAAASTEAEAGLRRVIVMGASIGGPDAVRNFLTSLPENFPAAFLLVQHLESGYFERLAQQLQKSVKMPVGVLGADKVKEGHVYVVPANARFSIANDGSVSAAAHDAPPKYTPSIDNLFIDVAERFGPRVTAIIFSGMAGDAIEGAVKVAEMGGEVWAQDPSSCVVAAMVEGAQKRGVVGFTGAPVELAQRLLLRYGVA